MADDNVVRPVFGKRKPDAVPIASTTLSEAPKDEVSDDYKNIGPLTGKALVRAQKDLLYMQANYDFVHEMRNKLEEAGDGVFALRDFVPDVASIRLRRQGLKSHSLEDMCEEIKKTHQLQWRSQPSYIGALTLEFSSRVQVALSLMSDEGQQNNSE